MHVKARMSRGHAWGGAAGSIVYQHDRAPDPETVGTAIHSLTACSSDRDSTVPSGHRTGQRQLRVWAAICMQT